MRAETGGLGKQISLEHLKCRKHRGTLRDERGSGKHLVYYKKRSAFVRQVISNPRRAASGEESGLCGYIYSGGCAGDGQEGWSIGDGVIRRPGAGRCLGKPFQRFM